METRARRRSRQLRTNRLRVEQLEDRRMLSILPGYLGTGICDNQGDIFSIDVDFDDLAGSQLEHLGRLTVPDAPDYSDLTYRDIAYTFSGDDFYAVADDVGAYFMTPEGWPSLLGTVDVTSPVSPGELEFNIIGALRKPIQGTEQSALPVWANALEVNPVDGKLYAAGAHMQGWPPNSSNYAIYEVDVASAGVNGIPTTPIVDLGSYRSSGDMAFDEDGTLHLTTTSSELITVDVMSATPSILDVVVTDTEAGDFDGLLPTAGEVITDFIAFRQQGDFYELDTVADTSTQIGTQPVMHVELDDLTGATVAHGPAVEITDPIHGLQLLNQTPALGQLWYRFQPENDGQVAATLANTTGNLTLYKQVQDGWEQVASGATTVSTYDADSGSEYALHVENLAEQADLLLVNGDLATLPPRIMSVDELPMDGGFTSGDIAGLTVNFSKEMAPATVNDLDNWELIGYGPDGAPGGGDDATYSFAAPGYTSGLSVSLEIAEGALALGEYQFRAVGSTSLQDLAGTHLDGNTDGTGGDDYVNQFSVTIGFGVVGDSLSDEYAGESYNYAFNWVESLVSTGRVYAGAWDSWGEPRREGYDFNWARSGATSATLLSEGQHTGLAQQINDGEVGRALMAIGQNDYFPTTAAYQSIYFNTWSQNDIDAYNATILGNIETALATLTATDVELVLSNVIDYGNAPIVRAIATNPVGRERATDAVRELNAGIAQLAADYRIPLVDSFEMAKTYFGENGAEIAYQLVGGVQIANDYGQDPHNGVVGDGIHPHTVVQAVMANLLVEGFKAYGVDIQQFSEQEMLSLAGIGGEYTADTLGIDYSEYIIMPPNTGRVSGLLWYDLNADGIQQAAELDLYDVADDMTVQLFEVGPDGFARTGDDIYVDSTLTDVTGEYAFDFLPVGTYYLQFGYFDSALVPEDFGFTVMAVGLDDSIDSDVYSDGTTDPFSLSDSSVVKDAGFVNAFTDPIVIPDPVDYLVLPDQTPTDGQLRYTFQASRDDMVSVKVQNAGSCTVSIYDQWDQVAHDNATDPQADWPYAQAGDTFYVHIAGLESSADVIFANVLQHSWLDESITIFGTEYDDTVRFSYGDPHQMSFNDVYYDSNWMFDLSQISFEDGGTLDNDTVTIIGSPQNDTGTIEPYSATLYANGDQNAYDLKMSVNNAETIIIDGAAGEDTGTLEGSANVETFTSWPGLVYWRGNPFHHTIINAENLTVNGGGGGDVARLHDSDQADTFTAGPTSATLSGGGFTYTVNNQARTHAYADNGGEDTATLEGAVGTKDTFEGRPDSSFVEGSNSYSRAWDFEIVNLNAVVGENEMVNLFDSGGDDTFAAGAGSARMTYENGHLVNADNFSYARGYAQNGGNDVATLTGAIGLKDTFEGRPRSGKAYGDSFSNRAVDFETVHLNAIAGEEEVVKFFDSGGADTFVGSPGHAQMTYQSGAVVYADDYRWGHAFVEYGGNDTATLNGAVGTKDNFDCTADVSRAYGNDFYNRAVDFKTVDLNATAGENEMANLYDSGGNDTFAAGAGSARMTYENGHLVNADNFSYARGYAQNGGNDVATLTGAIGLKDTFEGRPRSGKAYGDSFSNRAVDFETVHLNAIAGEEEVVKFFDSGGADTFVGSPGHAQMTYQSGAVVYADDYRWGHAFVEYGGNDTATLNGAVGSKDTFDGRADVSRVCGTDFHNRVFDFKTVDLNATAGENEMALISDSPGADSLVVTPYSAKMTYENGHVVNAGSFRYIRSSADKGGDDVATLEGAAGTKDVFEGRPQYGKVYGSDFDNQVSNFETVRLKAIVGEKEIVNLYDSGAADTFVGKPDTASLTFASGAVVHADNFYRVHAYATAADPGSVDVAYLYGTTGNDVFKGDTSDARLYSAGMPYLNRAWYFDEVHGDALSGDNDQAFLKDTPFDDTLNVGTMPSGGGSVELFNDSMPYKLHAMHFDYVLAESTSKTDSDTVNEGTYSFTLDLDGFWENM